MIIDAHGASITYGQLRGVYVCVVRKIARFFASGGLRWCRGLYSRALVSKKGVLNRSETCLTLNQGHESYSVPEL